MELLSAASFDMSTDSLSYWTFDVTRQLWVGRPCFDLSLSTSTDDCYQEKMNRNREERQKEPRKWY